MSEEITIRTAVLDDAEALRSYAAVLFAENLPTILRRPTAPSLKEELDFVASCLGPPNCTLLVAELEGRIVGMLDFHGHPHPQRRHVGKLGLSVAAGHRGRGIGALLLEALLAWAPDHGITRIELEVQANNPNAIRLYERLGFGRECVCRQAVAVDDGFVDLIRMVHL